MKRTPKYRIFGEHRYERVGSAPSNKREAKGWADFQRRVNKLSARVVPARDGKGYEIYIRRNKR